MGVVTVAATIALTANLFHSLFGIPMGIGSIATVVLFTLLSMYGAAFLRKFNTVMTISLTVCLLIVLIAVIQIRGPELAARLFDFKGGLNWTGSSVSGHLGMFLSYCFISASWGGTLSNYSEKIRTKKDFTN